MKPDNVFAQDMMHIRPILPRFSFIGEAEDGEVVGESVHPHVDAVAGVVGDGNAPLDTVGGARHAGDDGC